MFAYYSITLCSKPEWYNLWAILALEVLGVIFWLTSFALCAEWTSAFNHVQDWRDGEYEDGFWNAPFAPEDIGLRSASFKKATSRSRACVGLMGAASGLGALQL